MPKNLGFLEGALPRSNDLNDEQEVLPRGCISITSDNLSSQPLCSLRQLRMADFGRDRHARYLHQ